MNPNLVTSPRATLREALESITKNGRQAVLVVEADGLLAGMVTDGDVRRALLRGGNVIDVEPAREDILRGIDRALDRGFRAGLKGMANPYGDGQAATRIVEVLRAIPLDARLIQKRFEDSESGA